MAAPRAGPRPSGGAAGRHQEVQCRRRRGAHPAGHREDGPIDAPAVPPPPVVKAGKPSVSRYAVAVLVGPDLLLTAAAPLEGAGSFHLETASGSSFEAQLLRRDPALGLALLRVSGQRLPY